MISIQYFFSPQLSIFPQAYADPLPQNDVMDTETETYTLQTVGCHWEFGEDFLRMSISVTLTQYSFSCDFANQACSHSDCVPAVACS